MTGFVKNVGKILLSPLATAAGLFDRKPPPTQAPPTRPTVNEAALRAAENDRMARRSGTGSNRRTGRGGAESSAGRKTSVLGR